MFLLLCRHFGVRPRIYAGEPSFQALRNRRQTENLRFSAGSRQMSAPKPKSMQSSHSPPD